MYSNAPTIVMHTLTFIDAGLIALKLPSFHRSSCLRIRSIGDVSLDAPPRLPMPMKTTGYAMLSAPTGQILPAIQRTTMQSMA